MLYLDQVTELATTRREVEVAEEGQSVLPGSADLQLIGPPHVSEEGPVARWGIHDINIKLQASGTISSVVVL